MNRPKEIKLSNQSSQKNGNSSNCSFESSQVDRQIKLNAVDCGLWIVEGKILVLFYVQNSKENQKTKDNERKESFDS